MRQRRHFKQTESLNDRLAAFAKRSREKAEQLTGPERDALLKKARQADMAAHLDWASSPELQPRK